MIIFSENLLRPAVDLRIGSSEKEYQFSHLKMYVNLASASHMRVAPITIPDKRKCECFDLHRKLVPYCEAWYWQKTLVWEKKSMIEKNEECLDSLIVLQHPSVYTLGTGASVDNIKSAEKKLLYHIYQTERGGEVTYHGPGQLVMYPILNLRNHKMDLHWYLRALEEVIIRALYGTFSILASRRDGYTGVWVGEEKVAAIGVGVSRWITYHGLALNVATNLGPFGDIIPCGLRNSRVGSVKGLLGGKSSSTCVEATDISDTHLVESTYNSLVHEFCQLFQLDLDIMLSPPPLLSGSP